MIGQGLIRGGSISSLLRFFSFFYHVAALSLLAGSPEDEDDEDEDTIMAQVQPHYKLQTVRKVRGQRRKTLKRGKY